MKEIFYKEFSFENINKWTISKGLKIFLGEFAGKIQLREFDLGYWPFKGKILLRIEEI